MSQNNDLIQVIKNCIYREERRIETAKQTISDAEMQIIELKKELLGMGVELPLGE